MNRDDIIRMAREAGWSGFYIAYSVPTGKKTLTGPATMEMLERFFHAAYAAGAAAEREACARVCEDRYMGDNNREDMEAKRCAIAIRARGNK